MNLANTIKVMQLKQLQEAEEAAKYPHDMFDPETGEKEVANSEAEHKALAAKGYTHEKPEAKDEKDLDESFEEAMVDLEEARIKASDYEATSEKSKFGGHRPTVVHKTKGTTLWLGAVGFKTPKAAKAAADAYLSGYAIGSEKGAKRMLDAHIKNNKKNLVDPSILDEAANWIDGTKYQKEKKKKGFNKDDWEWNSSKQLYKKVEESVALDEGKMKEFHDYMQKGKSPEFIAKKMGLDLKTVKQLMDHLSESVDVSEAKKWKLTSMSQDEAIKEFGKKNVRLGRKNGLGRSTVEVYTEEVALDEKYQQFTDKTPNWGEDQALTYGRKKGYKEVAVMSDNNSKHPMVLFALDSGDKKYIKGSNVKSGETVFRYATKISIAGDIFPLVKVNIAKGIYYNLTQESSEGTIEDAKFENKGVKLKFFRSLEGAIKESVELDEAKFGDNDLVHIAKANVRAPNNAKTDKIIGYSKAPKNPNKFPDPKSGANAIMRIADAKKKGFKIESAELNEDHFIVQYYDKKGKADTTKFSKFDDASKAKKYLDRANKTSKEGEYKMLKVKGKMEGLEEANVFGTRDNYGSSDELLAAINAVVSGQAATVEVSTDDTNAIVEQGVEVVNETKEASTDEEPAADDKKDKKEKKDKTKVEVDVKPNLDEAEQSAKQKKYQAFFQKALKKFGAKSPAELEGDNEKKFYAYVDANWKSEDETE